MFSENFYFYFSRYFPMSLFFIILFLALFLIKKKKSKLLKYTFISWFVLVILYAISFVLDLYNCSWALFGEQSTCNPIGTVARNTRIIISLYIFTQFSPFLLALEIDALIRNRKIHNNTRDL